MLWTLKIHPHRHRRRNPNHRRHPLQLLNMSQHIEVVVAK
jgi:hypothetical protein